jgi:predicted Zn-dependent protease
MQTMEIIPHDDASKIAKEHFGDALNYFDDALRLSQFNRSVVLAYGDMLMRLKKYAKAREIYQKYLSTNPDDNEIRALLLQCENILQKVSKLGKVAGKVQER